MIAAVPNAVQRLPLCVRFFDANETSSTTEKLGLAKMKFATVMASAALALTPATFAFATVYNFDVTPHHATCDSSGGITNCFAIVPVVPASDNPGDQYNVDVIFPNPLHVPGAKTESLVYAAFYDSNTTIFGASGVDDAISSLTMLGYSGPPNPGTGPFTEDLNSYVAIGGFLSPNPGFTLTGFDATLNIASQDPYPLVGLAVGYYTIGAPEPAVWAMMLVGFFGLGAAIRANRRTQQTVVI